MSLTSEESGSLHTPLLEEEEEEWVADAGDSLEASASPTVAPMEIEQPGQSSPRSKKMSLYDEQSKWSDDVLNKRRSEYMKDLILQRQQTMGNLFEGKVHDEEEGDAGSSAAKISLEMHSAFVRHLQSYVRDEGKFTMPTVDIRVKNFSFEVPISESQAVPTLFTYSPIYWCKKAGEKLMRRRKVESAIRRKEVKSVLSNVNLALEPGKMYLIIGPPSSGKTSLLNGEKLLLQYFLPLDLSEFMLTNSLTNSLSLSISFI